MSTPSPSPYPEPVSDDEMMRRAEAALFGRPSSEPDGQQDAEASKPARRILEAIVPEAEPAPEFELSPLEPKRRGRKPGSKNKPKSLVPAPDMPKRPRGRPPKNPDLHVRTVVVTPEIAEAALATMQSAVVEPPRLFGLPIAPAPGQLYPQKRPRGRPRKVPIRVITPNPGPMVLSPDVMSADRILRRYGPEAGVRVGRLWTRRLRRHANPTYRSRHRSDG